MTLVAIGINHKTAPVDLREQVAFTPDSVIEAIQALQAQPGVDNSVILSTCNRTELYASVENSNHEALIDWLAEFHGVDVQTVTEHTYVYNEQDALKHVMRVASGLDSLVLGEPQILGQVKQAFNQAKQNGAVSKHFEHLFQHVFSVAKKVRTDTNIGENAVSVAFAAVQLAKQIFAKIAKRKVLLIGAGETIELVATHLKQAGVTQMAVANRTRDRAAKLATQLDGKAITLSQLPDHMHEFDIVISSTASQLPLVGKGMIGDALKKRKNLPMFLVDLAVPRDIEPQVEDLDDAFLYTVDDLQHIVEANIASREEAAKSAIEMIETQVVQYESWKASEVLRDYVRSYRKQAEQTRNDLVEKAVKQLEEGKDPEQLLRTMAYKLSNTLMHAPTKMLADETLLNDSDAALRIVHHFDLDGMALDSAGEQSTGEEKAKPKAD